MTAFWGKIVW